MTPAALGRQWFHEAKKFYDPSWAIIFFDSFGDALNKFWGNEGAWGQLDEKVHPLGSRLIICTINVSSDIPKHAKACFTQLTYKYLKALQRSVKKGLRKGACNTVPGTPIGDKPTIFSILQSTGVAAMAQDEVHTSRNLGKDVIGVCTLGSYACFRIALTGTPIFNSLRVSLRSEITTNSC